MLICQCESNISFEHYPLTRYDDEPLEKKTEIKDKKKTIIILVGVVFKEF